MAAFFFLLSAVFANVFAQEKESRFIKIEIITSAFEGFSQTAKVPIIEKFTKEISTDPDAVYMKKSTTTSCFGCAFGEVDIFSSALRLNEKSSEVSLTLRFANKKECGLEDKNFVVQRGKRKELKSKCGIKISAYYE